MPTNHAASQIASEDFVAMFQRPVVINLFVWFQATRQGKPPGEKRTFLALKLKTNFKDFTTKSDLYF